MASGSAGWETTADVTAFLVRAGGFLAADPAANTALLTEAAYVARHPVPDADQCYGWWVDGSGAVAAAVAQAPRHPPLLSPAPAAAIAALPDVLPAPTRVGVDGRDVDAVVGAWRASGLVVAPLARFGVHRLDDLTPPPPVTDGRARRATRTDRPLLAEWFGRFKAAHPEDPSDLAFVVDDPLADGAMVLWEIAGEPVAMASRTPVVAGMTRMGLVYSPFGDDGAEADVLAAACAEAVRSGGVVLAMARADDIAAGARLAGLGFRSVGERVLLG